MTVCVFIAFYYKLLNLWAEHVIKSETHSNGWKETTVTQSQYAEAIKNKRQKIMYFLTFNVTTHSATQRFLSINK